VGAAHRHDPGDPPAGTDDHLAADLLAQEPVGEPTSSRASGVTVAALSPSPDSRIAVAAS